MPASEVRLCRHHFVTGLWELQEAFVKQGLELTESVFSGTAKDAAATMADLKQLKPKEASQITLGELQRWASIVRRSLSLPCLPNLLLLDYRNCACMSCYPQSAIDWHATLSCEEQHGPNRPCIVVQRMVVCSWDQLATGLLHHPVKISLGQIRHALLRGACWCVALQECSAAQIESYSFGALNADNEAWRYLVPLIDMANHNEEPNAHVEMDQERQAWVLTALRDIR